MKNIARISAFILVSMLTIMPVAQGENTIASESTYAIKLTGKETFTKLIKNGKYYSVDEELTEINPKFPTHRKGIQNVSLVSFQETIPIEDVVAELKARGLRPATVIELLAFGAQEIYAQQFDGRPILSPDAVILLRDADMENYYSGDNEERANYVYLRTVSGKRMLSVNFAGMFWSKHWRCLAVKISETENTTAPLPDGKSAGQKGR